MLSGTEKKLYSNNQQSSKVTIRRAWMQGSQLPNLHQKQSGIGQITTGYSTTLGQ